MTAQDFIDNNLRQSQKANAPFWWFGGKTRLVDELPARVGRLRGYGNAIVIPQAVAFIESYMECLND